MEVWSGLGFNCWNPLSRAVAELLTARAAEREAEGRDAVRIHVRPRPCAARAEPELRVLEHRPRGEGQTGGRVHTALGPHLTTDLNILDTCTRTHF